LSFEWKYFRFATLEKQFVVIAFCSDICRGKIVHWHNCLCMLCVNFRFVVTGPCTCVLLVVHVESHTFLVSRAGWCFWRVFLIVWQTHWSQIRLAIFFNFDTLRSQIFYAEQHDWSEILRHVFTDWFPSVVLMQSRNTYARKILLNGTL